ncbi:putative protein FAM172B isoform X1 [Canis lupus familiaris]|uniref:putative protein FAM172B isoform X1 n=1 Tax=Canis lupus familiaris TaxID=9615 RepID=UPI0018F7DF3E|nr:putative protein FAM172B isoform X1 [Canis lupus familiaris]
MKCKKKKKIAEVIGRRRLWLELEFVRLLLQYLGTGPVLETPSLWLPVTQELSFQKFLEQSDFLEELKYDFNEKAELRHTETQRPFVFNYYKNVLERNSKRYQALGHLLAQYIYELLEKVCKLQKVYIPPEADKEPRSFFFMSEKALLTSHRSILLVLLQDHGVFRAGQWSQQAIIHHGLQHGSQIPCIQMALQAHYDVIVLNPNDNFVDLKMEKEWKGLLTQNIGSSSLKMVQAENVLSLQQPLQYIPKRWSNTPEEHMAYIWDYFISKTESKDVAFIVHGYGGLVFMDLLVRRKWEVMNKVYAVALIDSDHHVGHQLGSDVQLLAWIKHHCREWVTSPKPLDKPAATVLKKEFPIVSAGTEEHNLAPSSSLQSIFKYLKKALKAKTTINFSRVPVVTRSSTKRKQSA